MAPNNGVGDAPCILIVDDNEDNVELLRIRLEAWGYRTRTAFDGLSALTSIETSPPDLVLLDVRLPGMDGMQVVRLVRANTSLPFVPIIMQTALNSLESKVQGLDAGADDYIAKPIRFAELEARLRSLLRIKALQDNLERRDRELASANLELQGLAQTDVLTGLYNRRHLQERLREMFEHAVRLNEPLACVLCDIDHFKTVNDTYGHPAGDAVLRQIGKLIGTAARETDRVGRYGGEEFMLLLPGTSLDAAVTFAERLRTDVERQTFDMDGHIGHLTMSCGAAVWPHPHLRDADALVRGADEALYRAKQRGRNQIARFDDAERGTPPVGALSLRAQAEERRGRRTGLEDDASAGEEAAIF